MLKFAHLTYGSTVVSVDPSETTPIPLEFDFNDAEMCARKIFAIMSNASGGHKLRACRLKYHAERQTANLTANGMHVYFAPYGQRVFKTVEEAIKAESECIIVQLGDVVTDQYGEGWKRAVWFEF